MAKIKLEPLTGDNVISGGKRVNIAEHLEYKDYWCSRGKSEYIDLAEGTWDEWVKLAKRILEIDAQQKADHDKS